MKIVDFDDVGDKIKLPYRVPYLDIDNPKHYVYEIIKKNSEVYLQRVECFSSMKTCSSNSLDEILISGKNVNYDLMYKDLRQFQLRPDNPTTYFNPQ